MEETKRYLDYEGLQTYHENLQSTLNDNNEIVAAALNDLNSRRPDWNEENSLSTSYIKNKPVIPNFSTILNNKEYVDLGLPSGILWAKCNIGADSEHVIGNYYLYGKGNSQYSQEQEEYEGVENPLNISLDTARQVMDGQWLMPTSVQLLELLDNTTSEWTTIEDVNGIKFTASNGNYIFIPAGGDYFEGVLSDDGIVAAIWTASPYGINNAFYLNGTNGSVNISTDKLRSVGLPVRGVVNINLLKIAITGDYDDLNNKPVLGELAFLDSLNANDVNALSSSTTYAGSSSVGGSANSAEKLNTNAGTNIQPVYFDNGIPVQISHTIQSDVPSDAVFTDTHHDGFVEASEGKALKKVSVSSDGTWNKEEIEIPIVDNNPTENSINAVSSGGVYSALDSLDERVSEIESNGITLEKEVYVGSSLPEDVSSLKLFVDTSDDITAEVYTKAESDDRYSLKTEVYTKTESDSKFLTNSDLALVAISGLYLDLSNKPTIPTKTSDLTNDSDFITSSDISGKANSSDLAQVATTGNYSDLSGKPVNVSEFTNDVNYLTEHLDISGKANISDLATVATSGNYNDLSNTPTNVSTFNNDAEYLDPNEEQVIAEALNDLDLRIINLEDISTIGENEELVIAYSEDDLNLRIIVLENLVEGLIGAINDLKVKIAI